MPLFTLEYSHYVACTQLLRLIERLELPLCFGEADAFEDCIKIAHNPRFCHVSKQTTTRDFAKYFNVCYEQLVQCFKSTSSIALNSNILV